jgi:hypothetical protein
MSLLTTQYAPRTRVLKAATELGVLRRGSSANCFTYRGFDLFICSNEVPYVQMLQQGEPCLSMFSGRYSKPTLYFDTGVLAYQSDERVLQHVKDVLDEIVDKISATNLRVAVWVARRDTTGQT